MKVAVLVPDGAADLPLEQLGNRTPLKAARTPNMDRVASLGATGTVSTIPPGMPPGSDVANLSLLGYDPGTSYGGRGPIEAANLGLEVPRGWTAFRCNLVSTDGERMLDYSAGHIGQSEASEIIDALELALGDEQTKFHAGKSYRHILIVKGDFSDLECMAPHDITGMELGPHLPGGRGAERIIEIMTRSRDVLDRLPVNERRSGSGQPRVDMIWLWGQGVSMHLEPFRERFGLSGGVISAVDLVNGLGRLAGLRPIEVPGITGFLDTNYRGKGEAAVSALLKDDFMYVHVEAPDEASHMGDIEEKVKALERFDSMVVEPVLSVLERGDSRILVCPDHPTFISTRTHDGSPVPYAVCGTGIPRDGAESFCEDEAKRSGRHFALGWKLMFSLVGKEPWP